MKKKSVLTTPASDAASRSSGFAADTLPIEGVARRNILMLACTCVAATSLGGIAGLMPAAIAQETAEVKTKILRPDHSLAKAAMKAAHRFPLGEEFVNLDLNVDSGIHAAVHEFTHSPEEEKRLGRKTSVLEGTVIALTAGSSGMKAIKRYMAAHKVPKRFEENSNFVAMTVRRRTTDGPDKLNLFKEVAVAEQTTFVCGISADEKKKQLTVAIVLPTFIGKRTKKKIRPGIPFKFIPAGDEATAPPPAAPPPDQTAEEKDFLGCFLPCLAALEGASSPLTGTFCAACITTIAGLPPTAGLDSPAVVVTCGGCFFLFLAPIVTCFAVCSDQL